MDQLEKIITEFKDQIQNDNPHEGHFERFEMKLKSTEKPKTKQWIRYLASFAAILIIGVFILKTGFSDSESITLRDLSEQYADVEFYYTSSINKQSRRLTTINNELNGDQSIKLMIEELESYDKFYDQLCKDLSATPNDDRVINALITYYQTKLEIINKILNEIENKQKNNERHENINI